MNAEKSEQLENQDWPDTFKRLVHHTSYLVASRYPQFRVRPGSQNLALGVTCEDIAQTAIVKVVSGQRSWPDGLDLFVVLKQVVRSLLTNLANKSASKKEPLLVDVDDSPTKPLAQVANPPPDDHLTEYWQVLHKVVEGDDELQLLIFAIEEALNLNQKPTRSNLAVILDIPPQDVTNQQRRLKRLARKEYDKLKTLQI